MLGEKKETWGVGRKKKHGGWEEKPSKGVVDGEGESYSNIVFFIKMRFEIYFSPLVTLTHLLMFPIYPLAI
jgi:hypothetical protein